ncbi:uncharacterized protein LOC115444187 isoform X2 [Manduca sexta]|uniref:uncharacterized protein LOC115444187 isoform X2 n=1 Tax=Manduca sexta TaxID=7130 RepID=UPI001182F2B9|nr:uncharacterized protein LOC115444187 isoform X2 [Manduca sexta]
MAEVEWTNEAAIQLIQEYEKRPELWDTNHTLYRVHTAKYEAWSDIARVFECDMTDLRKKLNSIFASHRREKAKVRCGGRSSWFLYPYMKFLPSHIDNNDVTPTPKVDVRQVQESEAEESGESNDSSSDDDNEEEQPVLVKVEPEIVQPRPKRRFIPPPTSPNLSRQPKPLKRRLLKEPTKPTSDLDSKLLEALKLLKRSELSRKKDECDSFGEYIATSLRKHDERTQSMIKQAINNILFEQEMKKYSGGQYTVVLTNMEENPLVLGDHETDK